MIATVCEIGNSNLEWDTLKKRLFKKGYLNVKKPSYWKRKFKKLSVYSIGEKHLVVGFEPQSQSI